MFLPLTPNWINVKNGPYNAKGDGVADDTAAIQAALNAAAAFAHPPVVHFPSGIYKITSPLTVTNSSMILKGDGSQNSIVRVSSEGVASLIYVHNPASRLFNVQIVGLRVDSTGALVLKPNGIVFQNASEGYLEDVSMSGCVSGLVVDSCEIVRAHKMTFSSSAQGVLQTNTDVNGFGYANLTMEYFTMSSLSVAGVLIDSNVGESTYTHGWIEETVLGFKIANRTAALNQEVDSLVINKVFFQNLAGTGFDSGQFFSAKANGINNYLIVSNLIIKDSRIRCVTATSAIEFLKDANVNAATQFSSVSIRNTMVEGVTVGVVISDTANTNGEYSQVGIIGGFPFSTGLGTWKTVFPVLGVVNGVTFPAVQVASTGVNTLDDYEEGTWVPTDGSGATLAFTNTSTNCRYTKIGRLVTASFRIQYPVNANGSSAKITGLPFACTAQTTDAVFGGYVNYTDCALSIIFRMDPGSTLVRMSINTGASVTNTQMSGKDFRGTFIYEVDS